MKKLLIIVGVLAITSSAMAVPISYTEKWDSYALGTSDANYVANWAGTNRYAVGVVQFPISPPKILEQDALTAYEIVNDLADGVELNLGESVKPTAANPVSAGIWWNGGVDRRLASVTFEVLSGTTVVAGVTQCTVGGAGPGDNGNAYFWRNWWWRDNKTGVNTGTDWNHQYFEIVPNATAGFDVTYHTYNGSGTSSRTFTYDPGVTTITALRISSSDLATAGSVIDDAYINGGEIVPEPATLALLGFGCLFLRRRRS